MGINFEVIALPKEKGKPVSIYKAQKMSQHITKGGKGKIRRALER